MMPGATDGGVLFQGVARESAAFRLMEQMGWKEGSGLGKEKQGIKHHVRVSKKVDNAGIGSNAAVHNWSFNTTVFDNILKNLKVQAVGPDIKDERGESGDHSGEKSSGRDCVTKAARPQGRYKHREKGKIVRNYSQADLNSILGVNKSLHQEEQENSISKSIPLEIYSNYSKSEVTEQPADWWGYKYGFVTAGWLGKSNDVKFPKDGGDFPCGNEVRKTFCEEDQENLYKLVQGKATTGRQGLGIGGRPKKIGGARWEGKRVTLEHKNNEDDSSHDDSMQDEKFDEQKDSTKKRKLTPDIPQEHANNSIDEQGLQSKLQKRDLRRLCKSILLQTENKKMSLRRMWKQIYGSEDKSEDLDMFRSKLEKSSKFLIDGTKVCLRQKSVR